MDKGDLFLYGKSKDSPNFVWRLGIINKIKTEWEVYEDDEAEGFVVFCDNKFGSTNMVHYPEGTELYVVHWDLISVARGELTKTLDETEQRIVEILKKEWI